jgi:hypothetical protein
MAIFMGSSLRSGAGGAMGSDLTGNEGDDKKGPPRQAWSGRGRLGHGTRPRHRAMRKIIRKVRAAETLSIGQPIAAQFRPQRNSMNVEAAAL